MFGQAHRFFPGTMLVLVGVLGVSTSASADTINIFADMRNSTEGLGDFSGMFTYDFVLGDMGVLTVDLTNDIDPGFAGFLTGFIFNFGSSDKDASAVLTSTTNAFFLDAQNQSGSPFGNPYLGGAALGGNWLGGGSPMNGIGPSDSDTFTFDITAVDADSLSAASFLQGPYDFNFLVRFRGVGPDGDLSDKVPGVPAPGALALLGFGALGQRRRRRAA